MGDSVASPTPRPRSWGPGRRPDPMNSAEVQAAVQAVPPSVNPLGALNGVPLPCRPTAACPPGPIEVNQMDGVKVPVVPLRVTVPLIPLVAIAVGRVNWTVQPLSVTVVVLITMIQVE